MKDLLPVAERIGALLKSRQQTIAVAESSAGGLISAALLAVPGASAYFLGGGVIYTGAGRGALRDQAGNPSLRAAAGANGARALCSRLGTRRDRRHRPNGKSLWRCGGPRLSGGRWRR